MGIAATLGATTDAICTEPAFGAALLYVWICVSGVGPRTVSLDMGRRRRTRLVRGEPVQWICGTGWCGGQNGTAALLARSEPGWSHPVNSFGVRLHGGNGFNSADMAAATLVPGKRSGILSRRKEAFCYEWIRRRAGWSADFRLSRVRRKKVL